MIRRLFKRSAFRARVQGVPLATFLAASFFLVAAPLRAGTLSWVASSGDWSNASNWLDLSNSATRATPGENDTENIANGGTVTISVSGEFQTLALNNGAVQMTGGNFSDPLGNGLEYIGDNGAGTFNQSGGINSVVTPTSQGAVVLGVNPGSSGAYTLNGSGVLNSSEEVIGGYGTGDFVQSGGINNLLTNNFSLGSVKIGLNPGSSGTYTLNGPGLLNAGVSVGDGGTGTFVQSAGTVTLGIGAYNGTYMLIGPGFVNGGVAVGATGFAGTVLQSAGNINVGSEVVGDEGTGSFTQLGGMNTISSSFGFIVGYDAGNGSYNLEDSGLLTTNGSEYIGSSGTGSVTRSGGVNSITGTGNEYVGYSNGSGNFTQSGGVNSITGTGSEYVGCGYAGTGIFTQSGGTNSTNQLYLAQNTGSVGTYNLNGGLLILWSLSQGSGSAAFNFSGGTLRASSGFSTSLPMTLGASGGGATFDTAGNTVILSGSLSGRGSLTLNDSLITGTLILTASNTYTGGTTINTGTLQLGDGTANNGSVVGNITDNTSLVFANPASQTYSGVIIGNGSLAKVGNGTLVLYGSNAYSGTTTVSAGGLQANDSAALGNSSGGTVANGASLALQGGIAIPAIPLNLSGAGASNSSGALINVGGSNSYSGPITIGSGGATIYSASAGSTLTLTGGIANGGNLLTIAGPGTTAIAGSVSGPLLNTGNLAMGGTNPGTLTIGGSYSQTASGAGP